MDLRIDEKVSKAGIYGEDQETVCCVNICEKVEDCVENLILPNFVQFYGILKCHQRLDKMS